MMAADRLFRFGEAAFDYSPYPIGYVPEVLPLDLYQELADTYPPVDLFKYMPGLGNKYSLSEVNRPEQYHLFLRSSRTWSRLHDEIKHPRFVAQVLEALRASNVDVGLADRAVVINNRRQAWRRRVADALDCLAHGSPRAVPVKTRFEFSMLPADGGHIRPHTDAPGKIVTLVLSCMKDQEWEPRFGGGTAVLRPKDVRDTYNQLNRYLEFDQTELIKTFPFEANQCVVFIKTYNSLHAVYPMTGTGSGLMRKTVTINLETYWK